MQKYGYENERLHALYFKVMEGYEDPSEEETIESIMQQIQEFLNASYMLGTNPLRELRRILPQYKWQYHELTDQGLIKHTVAASDFIWRVNWLDDMPNVFATKLELVTATMISSAQPKPEPSRWFWAGNKKKLERTTHKITYARACDGYPVYYEILDQDWMDTNAGRVWRKEPIKRSRRLVSTDVAKQSIDELEFSSRVRELLRSANINTIGELATKTADELLDIPNFGKKALEQCKEQLFTLGIVAGCFS